MENIINLIVILLPNVLGLTEKWILNFKDISITSRVWYKSLDTFDYDNFNNFVKFISDSLPIIMNSKPKPIEIPKDVQYRRY